MALSPQQTVMLQDVGRSFCVPTKELTQTDIKEFKANAIIKGIEQTIDSGIVRSAAEVVVRHALPFTDFGNGALGWLTENYVTGALAANAWGSAFSFVGVLPAAAPTLAQTKVAVFYKYADVETTPVVTGVRFRVGGNGATTKATFFNQIDAQGNLEPDVYFTTPVVYSPNDVVYIEVYPTGAIAVAEHIPFGAYLCERRGGNVS
jgi:hypothetical protein